MFALDLLATFRCERGMLWALSNPLDKDVRISLLDLYLGSLDLIPLLKTLDVMTRSYLEWEASRDIFYSFDGVNALSWLAVLRLTLYSLLHIHRLTSCGGVAINLVRQTETCPMLYCVALFRTDFVSVLNYLALSWFVAKLFSGRSVIIGLPYSGESLHYTALTFVIPFTTIILSGMAPGSESRWS